MQRPRGIPGILMGAWGMGGEDGEAREGNCAWGVQIGGERLGMRLNRQAGPSVIRSLYFGLQAVRGF